jgi:hypothetical protein
MSKFNIKELVEKIDDKQKIEYYCINIKSKVEKDFILNFYFDQFNLNRPNKFEKKKNIDGEYFDILEFLLETNWNKLIYFSIKLN